MKRCPFCAEEIQDAAVKCKHCGSLLTGHPADASVKPKYRDESAFGIMAITCYIFFAVGMMAVGAFFGQFGTAIMLSWSIIWGIITYSIGKQKGRPVVGFLLGLMLGPIGLLVLVLQN